MSTEQDSELRWHKVCKLSELLPHTGVCVLIGQTEVALFRVGAEVYALGNQDPFSGTNILSRGIVGDRAGTLKVSSPLHKQAFSLESGICLDDPTMAVPAYPTRCQSSVVEVSLLAKQQRPVED